MKKKKRRHLTIWINVAEIKRRAKSKYIEPLNAATERCASCTKKALLTWEEY